MKKLFPLFAILILFAASCNQPVKEEAAEEVTIDTVWMTVASFDTSAMNYVDQPVWIEGTVTHTCKHGGKRMFIADGSDTVLVEVTAGPEIVMFDAELEGSRVQVLGILKEERIDDKYLNEWEAEVLKPEEENHEAGLHEGTKGHEDHSKEDKLKQINALRNQLKESGKEFLAFYSVEAIAFEELPVETVEVDEEVIEE
jgi:hypothetical protein